MSAKLHTVAWYLKLLTYFIFGLSLASIIWLWLIKSPTTTPLLNYTIPPELPPAPEYVWSADHTKIIFQTLQPESEQSHIMLWNTKTHTSTTLTTLNTVDFWISGGQVDLAWLGPDTVAYAPIVTDDSLPTWEIIGASTTPSIWHERDIVTISPDGKKILTVVSHGTVPNQSLQYEIVTIPEHTIITTQINANVINCDWFENTSLKCYYTSVDNKKITFTVKVVTP